MTSLDAFIIGGGPAGAAAACLLAKNGWSVAVAESKAFPRRKVCGEYLSATNWPLLRQLGVADQFLEMAGPPVTETAVFVGQSQAKATLPRAGLLSQTSGRALCRERLDALLLEAAAGAGAEVLQPCRCISLVRNANEIRLRLVSGHSDQITERTAKCVIAAHGSWDHGELPTQQSASSHSGSDWLGFKAHFRQAALPDGLMPLLSFPDGYGGMVQCDNGLVSLSCCVQRRRINLLQRRPGGSAGDAVFEHIQDSTPVLRPIFDSAAIAGPWLSVGPIRTGVRRCYQEGVFLVGNAAGEAHPVVAEGISMAIQSAGLLVAELLPHRADIARTEPRNQIGARYTRAWRQSFLPRIRFAAAVAQWAKRPKLVAATIPWLATWPGILTWGAGISGKNRLVISGG